MTVSIWIFALFPLQGLMKSSGLSPARLAKMRVSLTLRSRSMPSRENARILAKVYPAYLRQSKLDWKETAGEVSRPMRAVAEERSPAMHKICRNIDKVFIKLLIDKKITYAPTYK